MSQYVDIFGTTQRGVVSPNVPHTHPYPTRYHGPIWNMPRFSRKFAWTPYAVPAYAGVGATEFPMSVASLVMLGAAVGASASDRRIRGAIVGAVAAPVIVWLHSKFGGA